MHGLDELSTDDVASYFLDYLQRPDSVEWINDSSAVILFPNVEAAAEALAAVTTADDATAPASNPEYSTAASSSIFCWRKGKPFRRIIRVYPKKRKRITDLVVEKSAARVERPLSIRMATTLDQRPPKAERKQSSYYAKLFGDSAKPKQYWGSKTDLEYVGKPPHKSVVKPEQLRINVNFTPTPTEPRPPRPRILMDATRRDMLFKVLQRAGSTGQAADAAVAGAEPASGSVALVATEPMAEEEDVVLNADDLANLDAEWDQTEGDSL